LLVDEVEHGFAISVDLVQANLSPGQQGGTNHGQFECCVLFDSGTIKLE